MEATAKRQTDPVREEELLAHGTADGARRRGVWHWQLLVAVVIVALWQLGSSTGALSARAFAPPADVLSWMWQWHSSGDSIPHVLATVSAAFLGYLVGVLLGVIVATTFVVLPFVERVFDPFMALINGIPKIVLAPFLVLVFGLGVSSKVAVAALLVFVASFFTLSNGLKSVDRYMLNNARVLGAGRIALIRTVYAPAMLTWVVSTLRIGIGFAMLGVVVGEFVGATQGIGWNIKLAGELSEPDRMLGAMLTLGLIAVCLDRLLTLAEKRGTAWRAT